MSPVETSTRNESALASQTTPRKAVAYRQILACLLFISSFLFGMHAAGLLNPFWTVRTETAVQLPSSKLENAAPGDVVVALPAKGVTDCSIVADGKQLALTKSPANVQLSAPFQYQINNGFVYWLQPGPLAQRYDIISPLIFRYASAVSATLAILALLLCVKELSAASSLVSRTAVASAQALSFWADRIGAIWSPLFGRSEKIAESSRQMPNGVKATVALAAIVLLSVIYCNSGTLSPLNLFGPLEVDLGLPTPVNIDHDYHYALYMLMNGQGHEVASPYDMYFRRVLFPFLSYPLMKLCGFVYGGMLTDVILNLGTLIGFCTYAFKRWGGNAAKMAAVLLCLYPGYAYYCGLPYHFSIIFPACLICAIALSEIERSTSIVRTFCLALAMGVMCLGYDVIGLFLPAMSIMLLWQRRFRTLPVALAGLTGPLALWCVYLYKTYGPACLLNANTSTFANAILAWCSMVKPAVFVATMATLPASLQALGSTFLYSTFGFLPLLFAVAAFGTMFMKDTRFSRAELSFLSWCGFLCFMCALAPDCHSSGMAHGGLSEWQPKGGWTIRLYQPVFAMYTLFLARKWAQLDGARQGWKWVLNTCLAVCLAGNFLTAFGTILNNPFGLASHLHYNFYPGTEQYRMQWNLATYGRLPLGFFDYKKATAIQHEKDLAGAELISTIRATVPPLQKKALSTL